LIEDRDQTAALPRPHALNAATPLILVASRRTPRRASAQLKWRYKKLCYGRGTAQRACRV